MLSTHEKLITAGYKKYELPADDNIVRYKNLWQKKVESEAVCETNDTLMVDIQEWAFQDREPSFEVSITAERHNQWWDLKCYVLNADDLLQSLPNLEYKLVQIFNLL